jgi:hypothetical protein
MEGQVPGFCRDSPDSYNHCNPNLNIYMYIYSRIPRTFVINQGFEMFWTLIKSLGFLEFWPMPWNGNYTAISCWDTPQPIQKVELRLIVTPITLHL